MHHTRTRYQQAEKKPIIKKLTFNLLILISITCCAQESITFKTKFKPNKKYKLNSQQLRTPKFNLTRIKK